MSRSYTIGHRCLRHPDAQQPNSYVPKTGLVEFHQEVAEDLEACWPELCYLALIALALSALLTVLLRYTIRFVVYAVLAGVVVACAAGTIALWVLYAREARTGDAAAAEWEDSISRRRRTSYLVFACIATLATCGCTLVIVALRRRIALVCELFREAGRACASMPLMLGAPFVTFAALAALVALWLYAALWIESAGRLRIANNASAAYAKPAAVLVARWWNVLALLWLSQFIVGCQQMLIAGAVATWFFTRDKRPAALRWPLARSGARLLRYHLGTVALGALCLAAVQALRAVFRVLQLAACGGRPPQTRCTRCLLAGCQCCAAAGERVLALLTRNAYIETALTGAPFCAAGRRATARLAENALRVLAINSVGDFVLLLGKVLVVAVTVALGVELLQRKERVHHAWVPLVLAGVVAFLVAHCFVTVYEMTIDTIFLCFCEDCERNDGVGRPYFMSRTLMQFVQDSKRALRVDEDSEGRGATTKSGAAASGTKAWSTTTTEAG